jgi:transcriptional regulator with XRE-family HTH domain
MTTDQDLANRLRESREFLGIPQEAVSQATGIPRPAISAIENGRRRVQATELERLASLYKFPVSYFLTGEGETDDPPAVQALARAAYRLTEGDRAELLRYAQFLTGLRTPEVPQQ